jgi:cytosine/adenosine deaminase-related metal-dependent hydrolase
VILRARIVLPLTQPPIEDGAVLVKRGLIEKVGKWKDLQREDGARSLDLGEVVLLPGLVNAHCHLDYSGMRIARGGKSFTQWAQTIIKEKSDWDIADYRKSWVRGARMLAATGTTTVADIEAVPQLLPWAWKQTPLRVFSFLEMTGVASGCRPAQILSEALKHSSRLTIEDRRSKIENIGLSPHALYSTVPELLRLIARRSRKLRVTMHVAESTEEMAMFSRRKGELFEWLSRVRDMSDCGGVTPVEAVRRAGLLGPNFLAVHANYLTNDDVAILTRSKASVVHCPSSHAYFGHARFPYEKLARAGVNLCVGTDSMASMRERELNMLTEMQQFARIHPNVLPAKVLCMATLNGARALGMEGKIGELKRGAFADLIAIPFTGRAIDAETCILYGTAVSMVMVDGQQLKNVK